MTPTVDEENFVVASDYTTNVALPECGPWARQAMRSPALTVEGGSGANWDLQPIAGSVILLPVPVVPAGLSAF